MAVMNNTEPEAAVVAAFEHDVRTHKDGLPVDNGSAMEPIATRRQQSARKSSARGWCSRSWSALALRLRA